ncbi:MAG: hypothetical protein J4G10_04740 [Alphaproteobacteria bacterium]|nr:hypothetical protein [Alphaproteobacteria bacterium]
MILTGCRDAKTALPSPVPFFYMGAALALAGQIMKPSVAIVFSLFFALALAACQNADWADMRESEDIPDGPGLLTGDDGEVVIYRQ